MSLPAIGSISGPNKDVLACTLALLVLSEAEGSTSASDVQKVTSAAGVQINAKVAEAFERGLQGKAVKSFLSVGGGSGSGSSSAPAPAAAESKPAAKEEKKRKILHQRQ